MPWRRATRTKPWRRRSAAPARSCASSWTNWPSGAAATESLPRHWRPVGSDEAPLAPLVLHPVAGGGARAGVTRIPVQRVAVVGDLACAVFAGDGADHAGLQSRAGRGHGVVHQHRRPGPRAVAGAGAAVGVAFDVIQ